MKKNEIKGIAESELQKVRIITMVYTNGEVGVRFSEDSLCYYDSQKKEIQIGVLTPRDCFGLFSFDRPECLAGISVEEETALYRAALYYLAEHEAEHRLSTAQSPYAVGIKNCTKNFAAELAKQTGNPIPRTEREFDLLFQKVGMSADLLEQLSANILNSVEDGRIEKKRSRKNKGFATKRKVFRHLFWERGIWSATKNASVSSSIMGNILSISTCGYYQKGYMLERFQFKEAEVISSLIPLIKEGTSAKSTRKMAACCERIAAMIAPLIIEEMLNDKKTGQNSLEETLKSLDKCLKSDCQTGTSEQDEDTSENEENGNAQGNETNGEPGESAVESETSEDGDGSSFSAAAISTEELKDAIDSIMNDLRISRANENSSEMLREKVDTKTVKAEDIAVDIDIKTEETIPTYEGNLGIKKLPMDLEIRGKRFHKSNEKYFRNLVRPSSPFQNHGAIDSNRLSALVYRDTDIFKTEAINNQFNGCAYICVDNSGSMCGQKMTQACQAAAIIEEGFKGLFPYKIVAGSTQGGRNRHWVIKNWEDVRRINQSYAFVGHPRSADGGTRTDADIAVATAELCMRSEAKKMMVVICDGYPDSIRETNRRVLAARKSGILVIGILITDDDESMPFGSSMADDRKNFEKIFEKDFLICSSENLERELTKKFVKFTRT